ncbi:MAG TPA: M4 family metallopeptidase, partial [Candidatus Limnocylindrales bacterium]|nr:M4 family metallopeptidase [Candidatus Limnocylindrales bacterium]
MRRRTPKIALAVISAMVVGVPTIAVQPASADPGAARVIDAAAVAAAVDAYVAGENASLLKSPHDVMTRASLNAASGIQYHAYERTHRGLAVIGGDSVVVTGSTGNVLNTYNAQDAVIDVATTPAVGADAATATAKAELGFIESVSPARLVVLAWGTPRLAWEVKLSGAKADGTPSVPTVYVDAKTGKVADKVDLVREGTGNSFYVGTVTIGTSGSGTSFSMNDTSRPGISCANQSAVIFTGTDDVWGNGSGTNLETACVDALFAVQREWDMLSQWLGRNGINGSGRGFQARVGLNQANAFWNGSFTSFGHNSANTQQATSIDVVAHEFGHAIFQNTPGGAGSGNENGGLNEGTGDVFGAATEAFANNPGDPPDFLVGEEVNLVGSGPIRDMYNPANLGDPSCWSTAIPNTEVHAAAGPLNHWFTMLSRGSGGSPNSPTCAGAPAVTGIGVQSALRIYYGAMLAKTSTWRYANVRLASLNAAVNLFGANSAQCTQTKNAWNAVSVPVQAGEPTCGGGGGTTVFFDDFEAARGWTTNPNGTDTATTGMWERGDPEQTTSGVTLQLGTTVSGVNDLVTARLAGASAGVNDVDSGTTSIQSPAITLPATGTLSLSFSWYLAHLNNATSADFFRISVVNSGGTATAVLTQTGSAVNRAGAWVTGS